MVIMRRSAGPWWWANRRRSRRARTRCGVNRWRPASPPRANCSAWRGEHDPEKWEPVFGKDRAPKGRVMRRGLMGWNAEELPVATLEARLARLRAGMAKAGMDAFIIYTNNTRPSAVAYVTGFTPYWSDAPMLVRKTGAPVFATALSKRESEWIRTTDPVSEIVNTPKPGTLMGERLAKDAAVKKVGILEYD